MAATAGRQVVKYNFYKVAPEWRRLSTAEREQSKAEFASMVEETALDMQVRSYSLVGVRADADILLWCIAPDLEQHHELAAMLNRTRLGAFLATTYSYLAMTRHSQYVAEHKHSGQEGTRLTLEPGAAPYLVVYPFVKTRPWYTLPREERQAMMNAHFAVGHKYPSVRINTTYSFGLDDQEFVLAFETSSLSDFQDLVVDLRETRASAYTLRDTPIFTAIARPLLECLDALG